jgi:hypothetical protein
MPKNEPTGINIEANGGVAMGKLMTMPAWYKKMLPNYLAAFFAFIEY